MEPGRGVARRHRDASDPGILGRLDHVPGALDVDVERHVRGRRARVGNRRQMDHVILPGEGAFQSGEIEDAGLQKLDVRVVRRPQVHNCHVGDLLEAIDHKPAESAAPACDRYFPQMHGLVPSLGSGRSLDVRSDADASSLAVRFVDGLLHDQIS